MMPETESRLIQSAFDQTPPEDGFTYEKRDDFVETPSGIRADIAVVLSGGGMKCSYTVGALVALLEKFGFEDPSLMIAGSGSSGTASYFIAGQFYDMVCAWANALSNKDMLNFLRWRPLGVDHLIDDIFKKEYEIEIQKLRQSLSLLMIPATDYDTAEIKHFCPQNGKGDFFEMLKATMAMPIAYRKVIEIMGARYCDTYISSRVELNIEKALQMGAKQVLAVDLYNPDSKSNKFFNLWKELRLFSPVFRAQYDRNVAHQNELKEQYEDDPRVLILKPIDPLETDTLDNDKWHLRSSIVHGHRETVESEELERFLTSA